MANCCSAVHSLGKVQHFPPLQYVHHMLLEAWSMHFIIVFHKLVLLLTFLHGVGILLLML